MSFPSRFSRSSVARGCCDGSGGRREKHARQWTGARKVGSPPDALPRWAGGARAGGRRWVTSSRRRRTEPVRRTGFIRRLEDFVSIFFFYCRNSFPSGPDPWRTCERGSTSRTLAQHRGVFFSGAENIYKIIASSRRQRASGDVIFKKKTRAWRIAIDIFTIR